MMKESGEFYRPDELSVVIGFYSVSGTVISSPLTSDVIEIITHTRFNKESKANNLALLKV